MKEIAFPYGKEKLTYSFTKQELAGGSDLCPFH
jgi:hypothetical protein